MVNCTVRIRGLSRVCCRQAFPEAGVLAVHGSFQRQQQWQGDSLRHGTRPLGHTLRLLYCTCHCVRVGRSLLQASGCAVCCKACQQQVFCGSLQSRLCQTWLHRACSFSGCTHSTGLTGQRTQGSFCSPCRGRGMLVIWSAMPSSWARMAISAHSRPLSCSGASKVQRNMNGCTWAQASMPV